MAEQPEITPEMVLWAYKRGVFPMAQSRSGMIDWYSPDPRAILPLDGLHISRSLHQRIRRGDLSITYDQAFGDVIRGCAEPRRHEPETWINEAIIEVYNKLHERGVAHSVEAWASESDERQLVGGIYGVVLGGAFFGESMFSRVSGASSVCLVRLVQRLCNRGFHLFDVQLSNPHLKRFGVIEISRADFLRRLDRALLQPVSW